MTVRSLFLLSIASINNVYAQTICPIYRPIITEFDVGVETQIWYKVQKEFNGYCIQYSPKSWKILSLNADDISLTKVDKKSSFMVAPLVCSAKGTHRAEIEFEADDDCYKGETIKETFEFTVKEGLYPCFATLIPELTAYTDFATDQVFKLPELKHPIKFESAEVLKAPKWLTFDLEKWELTVAAKTTQECTLNYEIEFDLCKVLPEF